MAHKSADMVCHRCPCVLIHSVHAALCDQQCLQDGVQCNSVLRCLQVDVVSKRCQEPGCTTRPNFGVPGGREEFCLKHKSADMVCDPGVGFLAALLDGWAVPIAVCAIDSFVA